MSGLRLLWTESGTKSTDFALEDPLAFMHLESQIGNWLWPGFTSRTTHGGYHVMVAYGLLIAETLAKRYGLPATDDSIRAFFERWERLWAMAICVAYEGNIPPADAIRGHVGVTAAYRAKSKRPPLDYRLIARHRELGALGAYLPSLRAHHLVANDRLRVTPLGWELAQWMWEDPGTPATHWDEFVIEALKPSNTTLPEQVGPVSLAALGTRASPSNLRSRSALQEYLWKRLFDDFPPPKELAALPEMARVVIEAHGKGVTDPREIISGIAQNTWKSQCASELRSVAAVAVAFGDLSRSLRTIFDRSYQAVLSGGYEGEWSQCVRAAIPAGFVAVLDQHVANWQRLKATERIATIAIYGPIFLQVVRRMNTRNVYHVFESVLNLHGQVQRARGRGEGWIDRQGSRVLLRHSGYERWALEGTTWAPGYRMDAMAQLLRDLGRMD